SSTCSKPSSTTIATFSPFRFSSAMVLSLIKSTFSEIADALRGAPPAGIHARIFLSSCLILDRLHPGGLNEGRRQRLEVVRAVVACAVDEKRRRAVDPAEI